MAKKGKMIKTAKTSEKVSSEILMHQINVLKQTSIQSAVESTGLSILFLLIFISAPSVFPEVINPYDPKSLVILQGIVILPLAYWLISIIGNMIRLWKAQKLQKELLNK